MSICFCFVALCQAQIPEPAADSGSVDPKKAALIRQIVGGPDADQVRRELLDVTVPQHLALIRKNSAYPAGYVDELEKKLKERVSGMDFVALMMPVYAQHFSVDELTQIVAFQTSPVGRKLAAAQPELLSEFVKRAASSTKQLGVDIDREIFAEHPEYAKQIRENQGKLANTTPADAPVRTDTGDQPPYRIGGGVSAPVLISKTEPTYSPEARKARVSGRVLLAIIVDADGTPRDIRVVRPLGVGLDEKAIEAVSKWRFRPGMKDGVPVATMAQVEVNFRLVAKPTQ